MKILWLLVICQIKTNIAIWGNFSPFFQFLYFRHELNQSRTTQVQSQQRYVNELESAKRTFEAQLHQEHESQKNLVVNLQGQVQFHMSRANSLQATIGTFFIAIFFLQFCKIRFRHHHCHMCKKDVTLLCRLEIFDLMIFLILQITCLEWIRLSITSWRLFVTSN